MNLQRYDFFFIFNHAFSSRKKQLKNNVGQVYSLELRV